MSLEDLPDTYQLLEIDVPRGNMSARSVREASLPEGWQNLASVTLAIGDKWLKSNASAIYQVPCAIVPNTTNTLINPRHPDAQQLRIVSAARYPFDERLS
jgi:RES domain-containing protein